MKSVIFSFLLILALPLSMNGNDFKGIKRITANESQNESNSWINFVKLFELSEIPEKSLTQIACDSKYWLWINEKLVVFEGQLKRGPTPNDTYYDEVDIAPYLDKLDKIRRNQDNMLLGVLMDDYINFVDILSQEANIMDKSFFIVVPFYPTGDLNNIKEQTKGFFGRIFSKPAAQITKIDRMTWDKARDEIKNRVDSVTGGLFQMGIKSVQLNTKELGELYYNAYNPDTAVREPLGDFENITTTFVRKGDNSENDQQDTQGGING